MSLGLAIGVFLLTATIVVRTGTALAASGHQIAKRTSWSGLFVGTLMLAFATSLPELVTDITAAATGAPDLAVADLFGSSMANMAILAIVYLRHRGRVWPVVELGHSRVAAVAIVLTAVAALGLHTPPGATIGWVGVTPILIFGLYLAAVAWFRRTPTLSRISAEGPGIPIQKPTGWQTERAPVSLRRVILRFVLAAAVVLVAAPVMTISAERISALTGIAQTSIGVILLIAYVGAVAAVTLSGREVLTGIERQKRAGQSGS